MSNDPQSRKWMLTINNPMDTGMDHATIIDNVKKFEPKYYCLADEIGKEGTYHTHIFWWSDSPSRFSTVKRRFPTAHIDKARGTVQECRDYACKEGRWRDSSKSETKVSGTFEEWGELPTEQQEKAPSMVELLDLIKEGLSNTEIIERKPEFAFRIREIETIRQEYAKKKYETELRFLDVTYLYGATGTGKTRGIMENHGPKNICRITNYRASKGVLFDNYYSQEVLVFEEFCSQIPLEAMLNFLDIYPLHLPARYNDRIACYTTVYITSNTPLELQYSTEQEENPEAWKAFLRRIHNVIEYRSDGTQIVHKKDGEKVESI